MSVLYIRIKCSPFSWYEKERWVGHVPTPLYTTVGFNKAEASEQTLH